MNELTVYAVWDAAADVWVATSEDVPGLATEADTVEKLIAKLKVMIPELLEANGYPLQGDIPFRLEAKSGHIANAVLKQAGLPKAF